MAEETQVPARQERVLAKAGFTFMPQTWEQLFSYAKEIAQTDFVPKQMQGKPGAVLAAWQKGQEVGLPPMAALDSIAIINGRPSIHSDGYWTLIVTHPMCEYFDEDPPDVALKQGFGRCIVKRRNNPKPTERKFSMQDAKTAGLIEKDNWKHYPGIMLMWRARHLAGDGAIPEAAQGLVPEHIARDLEPRDVTPREEIPFKKPEALADASDSQPASAQAGATMGERGQTDGGDTDSTKRATEKGSAAPDREAAALEWVANAPDAEIMDNNELSKHIKGLKQAAQLTVCQAYNARRQAILAELKEGNADSVE